MKFFTLRNLGAWLLLLLPLHLLAGDYEKAWDAIHRNDRVHARELLLKAIKSNVNRDNAVATLIMLESYDGIGTAYLDQYPDPFTQWSQPQPYVYALWFNSAILGDYGKMESKQLAHLDRLLTDSARFNGSIRAAGHYFKGHHYFFSQQRAAREREYPAIGALEDWQFVGPFDNISGSGFNKDYGPLTQPDTSKSFISYNNSPINWFTPLYTPHQGWVNVTSIFPADNAVGYAQTFVLSPVEQDAILCLGTNGATKVWLNDKLLLTNAEEHTTELDAYKARCHLRKGYNRVLVQIGFTGRNNFPNFLVRLTNERFDELPNISSTSKLQTYEKDNSTAEVQTLTHFAEEYFLRQIKQYPQDPAYTLLLSKVYARNEEFDKAKTVMHDLFIKYPNDALVLNQYIACLSERYDRSEADELRERLKAMDPDNYWVLLANAMKMEDEKKYPEELELVNKMVNMRGETELTRLKKIAIYAYTEKMDSTIYLLKDAYARYPDKPQVIMAMYQYHKRLMKDPAAALEVLEKFCADNYSYQVMQTLAEECFEQNKMDRGVEVLKMLIAATPYQTTVYSPLAEYFFSRQQYDSAIYYMQQAYGICPYNHKVLGDIASCYMQKNDKKQALDNYRQALNLYAGGYNYRRKIRELENKPDVFSYFPKLDVYGKISDALKKPKDTTEEYYYIFDEKNVVFYEEGACEQMISTAMYVNNKKGIERWKEVSIPYNSIYQDVTIIKAEVIKANGSRVPAETYDNEVVFTRLEEGDAIYFNYKISSYGIGRLGREFWDKFYFTASVPTDLARFSVMVADKVPLYYEFQNNPSFKPQESKHENFRMYTWEMKDLPSLRNEAYMSNVDDIGQVLHISTVKSWDVIAEWYSDLSRMQCKEDFDLNAAYQQIFPKGVQQLNDWDKARRIYEYLEKNIAYSSVAFRQSAYIPQQASKTLVTRLGDCKDLSALFVAFARKAGMDANLVLVSTRDNGRHGLLLPSMEFNHCVARFKADNDYHFLELTDNALPFNAQPQSLVGAQILNIPFNFSGSEKIGELPGDTKQKVSLVRKTKVLINNADQQITTVSKRSGELASSVRGKYAHKSKEDVTDNLQSIVATQHKNPVELGAFAFTNLDNLEDTVTQELNYVVKNDVINVGDFSMIKPAFIDVVATSEIFKGEARKYPFEYWSYENIDQYLTEIDVELPDGKTFDQVPGDLEATFNSNMVYHLSYRKDAPNKLHIQRSFVTDRNQTIAPADFDKMKDFFNKIMSAEQKYISFK